jgi:hypothetical protein
MVKVRPLGDDDDPYEQASRAIEKYHEHLLTSGMTKEQAWQLNMETGMSPEQTIRYINDNDGVLPPKPKPTYNFTIANPGKCKACGLKAVVTRDTITKCWSCEEPYGE